MRLRHASIILALSACSEASPTAADGGLVVNLDAAAIPGQDAALVGSLDATAVNTDGGAPSPGGARPVTRGGMYLGFAERFNRWYTDPTWTPTRTIYISAAGNGDGSSRNTPAAASTVPTFGTPGTRILYLRGNYDNHCIELSDTESGTYDQPIVIEAEAGVVLNCCSTGRQTCINLENASYVAVTGFEMSGGNYGVRSVGSGYAASEHARGIAAVGNIIHDQLRDPILTGASDWAAWESNTCSRGGAGDGHGIYLSNGSDWNIVRKNELFDNSSADFQINADPQSTCADEGLEFDDPLCDAYAGTAEGGRGASDYMFIESNFFHHGNGQGANFTSVRRSVVRNNIFAIYARHGVSFWQETDNPNLGSSDNAVHHNLFVASNNRQMVQFIVDSTRNDVRNNLFVGVTIAGQTVTANPRAVFMETDGTVGANVYDHNDYISGIFDGDAPHAPNASEAVRATFDPAWFAAFPTALDHSAAAFAPSATAPFRRLAPRLPGALEDLAGVTRTDPTDPGPLQSP